MRVGRVAGATVGRVADLATGLAAGEAAAVRSGGSAAIVRVEKAQAEPASALACAASDSGAARNTAQCASSTSAVRRTRRQDGRWLAVAGSGWGMAAV